MIEQSVLLLITVKSCLGRKPEEKDLYADSFIVHRVLPLMSRRKTSRGSWKDLNADNFFSKQLLRLMDLTWER